LHTLLAAMIDREASDLHLVPGYRPMFRIHGELVQAADTPLSAENVMALVRPILPAGTHERPHDLDFAMQLEHGGRIERFRVNMFCTRREAGACFRHIPSIVPTIDQIGFPRELADRIDKLTHGLILCTGVTGAGKTT